MDRAAENVNDRPAKRRITRRRALQYGLAGAAGLAGGGALLWDMLNTAASPANSSEIFPGDAPTGPLWDNWRKRGWVKEACHYLKLGRNVQCKVCPNNCLLAPGDRSHCRNKVNKDGVLYTLAYGNPCSFDVDPVEKKPLFHFFPGTRTFSLATAGCVFRCLNCQNWEISQKKPEETKDASGPTFRMGQADAPAVTLDDIRRLSMFPEDIVALAQRTGCPSISYTYTEPIAYYEYTYDSCKLARQHKLKNIMVTCGSIEEKPLRELAQCLDAAHVDLKGFDESTYRKLNTGSLAPILRTLKVLKSMGVWFEIINLVVPTYTDDLETIKRMCGWILDHLGPDCPLHFSRFSPKHKLTHLPPTPVRLLLQARQTAIDLGLHYVYVGNVRGLADVENTFCPNCKAVVLRRDIYAVAARNLIDGRCGACRTPIAGMWG